MAKRTYLRDGRVNFPVDPKVSEQMSRIRAKNTKPELALRKALAREGIKGYRLHYAKLPGKPDVVFMGRRVAVTPTTPLHAKSKPASARSGKTVLRARRTFAAGSAT